MYNKQLFVFFMLAVSSFHLYALELDLSLGNAFSASNDIIIKRDQASDIQFTASYKTKGLKSPHYYSIRLRETFFKKDFEFELVHHKLYVDESLPEDITKFEITDGFNLLMYNMISDLFSSVSCRLGLGFVVAHPDVIIDGENNFVRGGGLIPKFWKDGYHWGGLSTQASFFYSSKIKNLRYHIESKLVYARSNIPVAGGDMDVRNFSIHFLSGISFGNQK